MIAIAAACCSHTAAQQAEPPRESSRKPRPPREKRSDAFRSRVEAVIGQGDADKAYWGALIEDAETGEVLYALNPDRYFSPASNAKLFTTAFALAALGADYRFRTTIETAGRLDTSGRLLGDIVLVGRGDPSLSNRKLPYAAKAEREGPADKAVAEMAEAVAAKGVRVMEGDVVADDSYFPYDPYPAGWQVGDLFFEFGAPVSALAVNDNFLDVEVKPGDRVGDPAVVTIEPWAGYEAFQHEIATGAAGSKLELAVVRAPGPHATLLRGSVPLGAAPAKLELAMDDPALYAAQLLRRLLEARGIRVNGLAIARHGATITPAVPTVLAEHFSPPLIELVRVVNKTSQNLWAEILLRTAAREKTHVGSNDAALDLEKQFFASAGIAEGGALLADGSGLSRSDLVTPRAVVQLLRFAAQQPWGAAFVSTLPVAGEDGTLAERLKGTAAAGRVRAKTGLLEHGRALAGFATTLAGSRVVFSIFVNNSSLRGKDALNLMDEIALAIVEDLDEPAKSTAR